MTTLDTNMWYFYRELFPRLLARGMKVTTVSSGGPSLDHLSALGAEALAIEIKRQPAPLSDLRAVWRMAKIFAGSDFDRIVVSTPKASLLASIAATLTGRRNRLVYVIRGRAYENLQGPQQALYRQLEKLTCWLASRILVISRSLAERLIDDQVVPAERLQTFANGSSKGVDLDRFRRTASARRQAREWLAQQAGVGPGAFVFGYVGWLRAEKGTPELVHAFVGLAEQSDAHLVLVGKFDSVRDPLSVEVTRLIREHPRIHHISWLDDPAVAFHAFDVFVFPTHREGFGNVAIEASAASLPIIATDVVGVVDAVSFDQSALKVQAGDSCGLRDQMLRLLEDNNLMQLLGREGRRRAELLFDQEVVLGAFTEALLAHE